MMKPCRLKINMKYEVDILGHKALIFFDEECGRWCGHIDELRVNCEESFLYELLRSLEICAKEMIDFIKFK